MPIVKGEPAETWITEGQSYLDRQAEVKRMKEKSWSSPWNTVSASIPG